PFALVAALGALWAREPRLELSLSLDRERALEGEEVTAVVTLVSPTGIDRLDLVLLLPRELAAARSENPVALRLRPGERRTLEVRLRCVRWGAFAVGSAVVRARDRLG